MGGGNVACVFSYNMGVSMIFYYFHGYGSSPEAKKCKAMKSVLGDENVIAPDFNNITAISLKSKLDKLAKDIAPNVSDVCIVGSSLGGLYALYVSAISGCECILLNPCLFPQMIIPKIVKDFGFDMEKFDPADVAALQKLNLKAYTDYNPDKVRVWVTKDDEVIDHKTLTRPFFYKKPIEYIKFEKKQAYSHAFIGFKKIFRDYA